MHKEVPLAKIGSRFVNGGDQFDITLDNVKQAIQNFEERGFPIPITKGHFEMMERQRQPAQGWVTKLFVRPVEDEQFLWGDVSWLKNTWDEIEEGKWKGLSLEFAPDDKGEKGENIGFLVDGAAILNYPFFTGARIDLSKQDPKKHLYTLTTWSDDKEKEMPKTKKKTVALQEGMVPIEEVVTGPAAEVVEAVESGEIQELLSGIGEMFAKLTALLAPAAEAESPGDEGAVAPPEEVAELVSREIKAGRFQKAFALLKGYKPINGNRATVTLAKEVKEMREERTLERHADEARRILMRLHADGCELGLGDFKIEEDDDEVRRWFKENDLGIEGLVGLRRVSMHPERLRRVNLGRETSSGKKGGGSGDVKTEEGRAIMVRKRAAEIRKEFADPELVVLAKKFKAESIEDGTIALARQELKIENPSVKEF